MKYRTFSLTSQGSYKEKGSRFNAYAFPVETKEQIQNQLTILRKTNYKARHHCYAYMLGQNGSEFKAHDDGEPRHSAGDPILGQLRSYTLTNALIVVVRYFGGTKLGVGGLIHAYREAAKQSIIANRIVEKELSQHLVMSFAYPDMNGVMKLVKEFDLTIVEQNFADRCELSLMVPLSKLVQTKTGLNKIPGITLEVKN